MSEHITPSLARYTLTHLSGNRYRVTSRNVGAEDAVTSASSLLAASAVRDASASVTVSDTYVKKNSTTNYSAQSENWICNNSTYGVRYTLLKVENLPALASDCFVTKAYIYLRNTSAPTADTRFFTREILTDWDFSTVTYANIADHIGETNIDFTTCKKGKYNWVKVDVTDLARKWYQGTNYGIALLPQSGNPNTVRLFASGTSSAPYFELEYASLSGLESYWDHDTRSVSRAGEGCVNLCSGNLVFTHADTVMNGNRMPVSVTHYYNACHADTDEFFMGWGWRCSLHQTLHRDANDVYWYTDGDGTAHAFGTDNKDEDGIGLTLSVNDDNITITDKGDNVMTFPLITTGKVLISTLADAVGNQVTVSSVGMKITSVTDGSRRVTSFDYQNGLLSAIRTPWQQTESCTRFAYTDGKLTGITHEDNKQSSYEYVTVGGFRLLTAAQAPDGTRAEYTYSNFEVTGGLPHAVTQAAVFAPQDENDGELYGSNTAYSYENHMTCVTDAYSGKTMRYHFNDRGNTVSVDDELGFAKYAAYEDDAAPNHATCVSRTEKVVTNLLKDSSFEDGSSSWVQGGTGSFVRDQTNYQFGLVSQKITIAANKEAYVSQTAALPAGEYTLSAYVCSRGPEAVLRVTYLDGENPVTVESDPAAVTADVQFARQAVSFTIPTDQTVTCSLCVKDTAGSAWFDCVQLEAGLTCNHYNMLHNSDFARGTGILPEGWSKESSVSNSFVGIDSLSAVDAPEHMTGRVVKLHGHPNRTIAFYQEFRAYGSAGDRFSFGGWAKAFAKEMNSESYVCCRITVQFYSGTWKVGGTVNFNEERDNWQFGSGSATASVNYNRIKVVVEYNCQMNTAWFGGLYLYPEQFGTEYGYDGRGNRITARSLWGKLENSTYDDFNNLTTYRAPGRTDAQKTVNNWGANDEKKKQHLLLDSISPLGTKTAYTYDDYGNPETTAVSDHNGAVTDTIETSTAYDEAGNYVHTQTDARGKTVTTETDANMGTTTSVTDPNNQEVNYSYDTLRRKTKVSTVVSGSGEHKTEYKYDAKDRLYEVRHNTDGVNDHDVVYGFEYDALGRQTAVKVGEQPLSETEYQDNASAPHYGTVSSVTYGNGFTVHNEYDDFNRVTGIVYGTETDPRYEFRYNARGQAAWMKDGLLDRITETEYDLSDRPRRIKTHESGQHLYTGEVTYDALYGHLSTFTERVGPNRTEYKTTFGYDPEDRPTALNYGSANDRTNVTYDGLGRVSGRSVTVNGHSYDTAFSYVPGATNSKTTGLIQGITQSGENFTYTYDDVGNISSVTQNGKVTSYVYDAIGQLIRVNDQSDTTAGTDGTTWTYEYDCGGNILNKKRYAYNTGALGTAQETITYTYGDENWKDKLTAYNGVDIAYDAIGNPTDDGTWRYTWENGRQLKEMEKGTDGQAGYMKVEYRYNSEGLRIQKIVTETTASGTTTTTTDYILHGKNIVHMIQGSDQLHFFYDASNRPVIVEYNGTKYAYIHNLQGDIVGIIDSTGTEVVKYTYDAWGKKLAVTGTLAGSLGVINPFRYRGYVYDEKTEMYYLRSRYYNSLWKRFINEDGIVVSNMFAYCRNNPIVNTDASGCYTEYPQEYLDALQAIYDYSIANRDNPKCIDSDEFLRRCGQFVGKFTYNSSPCAKSIAKNLEYGMSHTGMTSIFKNDILEGTELSISKIGGKSRIIEAMIVAVLDENDNDGKPYNHGGVFYNIDTVYHSAKRHEFVKKTGFYPDRFEYRNWNVCGWHKGVIASERLLRKIKNILDDSIDWSVTEDEDE